MDTTADTSMLKILRLILKVIMIIQGSILLTMLILYAWLGDIDKGNKLSILWKKYFQGRFK